MGGRARFQNPIRRREATPMKSPIAVSLELHFANYAHLCLKTNLDCPLLPPPPFSNGSH